ncbi:uncharacterized protein LOC143235761 [Tachypleus tridentatus]|uniref:uncharacterized protein LOC143235761 n=1 Tax=Tachypleus tridentatus TaxID=6853 RepID=UPI003FD6498C
MIFFTALLFQVINGQTNNNVTNITDHGSFYCRTERDQGTYLTLSHYHDDTCSRCYHYMPAWAFTHKKTAFRYLGTLGQLQDPVNKVFMYPRPNKPSHPIFSTFKSSFYANLWMSCCKAAMECCHTMLTTSRRHSDENHCPRTWDGWQCWPDTMAGQVALVRCPDHIYFKNDPPQCPRK